MNILFYRYNSICEPDMISAFSKAGLTVIEEEKEITEKGMTPADRIKLVEEHLKNEQLLFVFSVNFFPDIAEICHIYKTPYIGWTVDSPVPELFHRSITYPTSHIFTFDYEQYRRFSPYNPTGIQYLPLGTHHERFDRVIDSITAEDRQKFSHDISFVGSLYSEKNLMHSVQGLSDFSQGYIRALVEASLQVYGANLLEEGLTEDIVSDIKTHTDRFYEPAATVEPSDRYVAAHFFLGTQVTETERIRTLNTLAAKFRVDLYTLSDTTPLSGVHVHKGANSLTEMPKILHLSKINLNMTSKPIVTGLPLRIFDIMGCGGFVMTNFQAELTEYFGIGTHLESYSSMDELIEKCAFYLEHDDLRQQIALNGYREVCERHTYSHRVLEIIKSLA